MKTKLSKISYWFSVITLGIILGATLQFAKAWTEPTGAPPTGNVTAPINIGDGTQVKSGALGVDGVFRANSLSFFGSDATFSSGITLGGVTRTSWPSGGIAEEQDPRVSSWAKGGNCPCGTCWVTQFHSTCTRCGDSGYYEMCTPIGWQATTKNAGTCAKCDDAHGG